jgi:glycerol uptake operon antiterminator
MLIPFWRGMQAMQRSQVRTGSSRAGSQRHEPGEFREMLRAHPVIPALRSLADMPVALAAPSRVVYLLAAGLATIDEYLQALRVKDKEVIVNLDLFAGLSRNSQAVEFLASSGCAGIISTHTDVLGVTRSLGLYAVQRTFVIDSESVTSSMRSLRNFVPDALELLPAPVAPRLLPHLREHYGTVAAVGGGLIADLQEADSLIRQGLDAVSTGNPELWCVG